MTFVVLFLVEDVLVYSAELAISSNIAVIQPSVPYLVSMLVY